MIRSVDFESKMGRSSLSSAERAKRYRQKKKAQQQGSSQNCEEKFGSRARVQRFRANLSPEAKVNRAVRQKEYRRSKREYSPAENTDSDLNRCDIISPYNSKSTAGKAVAKAKAALPQNAAYRKYVWQRIGIEYGFLRAEDIRTEDNRERREKNEEDNLVKLVRDFYVRRDVSYTTPGMIFCGLDGQMF